MNRWWYVSKGEKKGPVSKRQLYHLLRAGTITAQSPLRKAGMKDWQPAARIDELVPLLKSLPLPPAQQYSSAGAWHRMRRHLGSSIVLGLGCLGVIAGLPSVALAVDIPHVATFTGHTLIAGAVMILGALAYRSAKKRKYGEGKATLTRQLLEFALLVPIFVVIFAVILSPIGFAYLAETNPVPNLVISIGAIAAYLVSGFMPPFSRKGATDAQLSPKRSVAPVDHIAQAPHLKIRHPLAASSVTAIMHTVRDAWLDAR